MGKERPSDGSRWLIEAKLDRPAIRNGWQEMGRKRRARLRVLGDQGLDTDKRRR
jgi:hypothetical protein